MLLGLCKQCDAYIQLFDSMSNKILKNVIVKGSFKTTEHGLPMWQSVQIKKTFLMTNYNNMKIQLIPKLNTPSSDPLWAIANVRQCPKSGMNFHNIFYFVLL